MNRRWMWAAALTGALLVLGAGPACASMYDTFDADPPLSGSAQPGYWYPDRFAPAAFESQLYDGDNRLHVLIDGDDYQPPETGRNYQGRRLDTPGALRASIELCVGEDWDGADRHASLWAFAYDAAGQISGYPIIGYTESHDGFVVWNDDEGDWIDLGKTADFAYGDWYKLMFDLYTDEIRFTIEGPTGATLSYSDTLTWGTTPVSQT